MSKITLTATVQYEFDSKFLDETTKEHFIHEFQDLPIGIALLGEIKVSEGQ